MTNDEAAALPFVWDERTLRDAPNLTLQTAAGDVDLMPQVAGLGGFAEVRAKAKPLRVRGITLMALDLPEIMVSKQATNRPKDRLQLPEIEAALLLRERSAASDTAARPDHAAPDAVQADPDRGEPGSGSGG